MQTVERLVREAEELSTSLQAVIAELRRHAGGAPAAPSAAASPLSADWVRTDKKVKAKVYALAEKGGLSPKAAFGVLRAHMQKDVAKYTAADQAAALAFLAERGV